MRPDPYILLLLLLLALAMGWPVLWDRRRRRLLQRLLAELQEKRTLIDTLNHQLNTLNMTPEQAIQDAQKHFDDLCTATEQEPLTQAQWDAAYDTYCEQMDLLLNAANGRPTGRKPRRRP